MNEHDSTPPVACTLTEERKEERSEQVRSMLTAGYKRAIERTNGYTLLFDGSDDSLSAVATFVARERRCCSFAEYNIDVSPPYEETRFTITGPDGTKTVFREGLIALLEAEAK